MPEIRILNVVKFDGKEHIGVKEPFLEANLPIYFKRIRNIWH
jgi:hypothetical protein